jgi:hypothetical protein
MATVESLIRLAAAAHNAMSARQSRLDERVLIQGLRHESIG